MKTVKTAFLGMIAMGLASTAMAAGGTVFEVDLKGPAINRYVQVSLGPVDATPQCVNFSTGENIKLDADLVKRMQENGSFTFGKPTTLKILQCSDNSCSQSKLLISQSLTFNSPTSVTTGKVVVTGTSFGESCDTADSSIGPFSQ